MNLIGAFRRSKLKIPSSFQKPHEKQKNLMKYGVFLLKTSFDKIAFVFSVIIKKLAIDTCHFY